MHVVALLLEWGVLCGGRHADAQHGRPWLTEQSEERALWGQARALPGMHGHCPLLPWWQALWGFLECRRCMPVGNRGLEVPACSWEES